MENVHSAVTGMKNANSMTQRRRLSATALVAAALTCAWTAPPASAGTQLLTVKGSLTYLARIALPPDSRAIIELRDSRSAEGPVIAGQQIDLKGHQVPVPFELSVDRARLSAGKRYVVRGTIVSAGQPAWVSEDVAVNLAGGDVDLGTLKLTRVQAKEATTQMVCRSQRILVSVEGEVARVTVGGQTFAMHQVKTASGAKYEVEGDPSTSFWSKGTKATLIVKGKTFPECTADTSGSTVFSATGNEPGWRLDIAEGQLTLQADYGKTRIAMTAPRAETVPGGTKYAGTAGSHKVTVTILDRLCSDTMTGMPRPNTVEVVLDGKPLKGCGGHPAMLLSGGTWVVQSLDGAAVPEGPRATLSFGPVAGRVAGSAFCNNYTGGYTLTAEGLTFGPAAVTRKACLPDVMKQEQAFLAALQEVRRFGLSTDGLLTLYAADKPRIVARRD